MNRTLPFAIIAAALAAPATAEPGDAERGAEVFEVKCAVCHGLGAEGDGPMASVLLVEPPDLTVLAKENGGVFPVTWVAQRVDGRAPIASHGGDMPVFGRIFDFPDGSIASETGQPIITAQPIADVIAWLATVQAE
ncbi:MAG: cytochrome c [Paracoccaceae bacterium]|nr:cytochrome c [Paracoccaceae bacterium]